MSSVVKNPMILTSVNYIYNWFTAINNKNDNLVKNQNTLNLIESDEIILEKLKKNQQNEEEYKNLEDRIKKMKESIEDE